jgi:dihydroneopterin aldolase
MRKVYIQNLAIETNQNGAIHRGVEDLTERVCNILHKYFGYMHYYTVMSDCPKFYEPVTIASVDGKIFQRKEIEITVKIYARGKPDSRRLFFSTDYISLGKNIEKWQKNSTQYIEKLLHELLLPGNVLKEWGHIEYDK